MKIRERRRSPSCRARPRGGRRLPSAASASHRGTGSSLRLSVDQREQDGRRDVVRQIAGDATGAGAAAPSVAQVDLEHVGLDDRRRGRWPRRAAPPPGRGRPPRRRPRRPRAARRRVIAPCPGRSRETSGQAAGPMADTSLAAQRGVEKVLAESLARRCRATSRTRHRSAGPVRVASSPPVPELVLDRLNLVFAQAEVVTRLVDQRRGRPPRTSRRRRRTRLRWSPWKTRCGRAARCRRAQRRSVSGVPWYRPNSVSRRLDPISASRSGVGASSMTIATLRSASRNRAGMSDTASAHEQSNRPRSSPGPRRSSWPRVLGVGAGAPLARAGAIRVAPEAA